MKKFIKNNIKVFVTIVISGIVFSGISVYAASQYFARDITFTPTNENFKKENGEAITNVEDALNELYEKSNNLNIDNLKLLKSTDRIQVESGKKYLISISIASFKTQNYYPSISSGAKILKSNESIHSAYGDLVCNSISYIVEATDNLIIINGNIADKNWNHITYYEF